MTMDNKKFALDDDQLDMVTGGTGGGSLDTELTHAGSLADVKMSAGSIGGGIQVSGNSVSTSISTRMSTSTISMSGGSIGGGSLDTELTHAGSLADVKMSAGSIGGGSTVSGSGGGVEV